MEKWTQILPAHRFFLKPKVISSPLCPHCASEKPRLTARCLMDLKFYEHRLKREPYYSFEYLQIIFFSLCVTSKICHCLPRLFDVLLQQVRMMLNLTTWTSFCYLFQCSDTVAAFLWMLLIRDYLTLGCQARAINGSELPARKLSSAKPLSVRINRQFNYDF